MKLNRLRPSWIPKQDTNKSWNTTDFNYNSTRWINDRKAHLRANPLCIECKKQSRVTPATVSDHIIPISKGGNEWDWGNRQALCESCHNKKNARERNSKYKK